MPLLNINDLIGAASSQANNAFSAGAKSNLQSQANQQEQDQLNLKSQLAQQTDANQRQQQEAQLMRLFGGNTPQEAMQNMPAGASTKVGDITVGQDPATKMLNQQMQGGARAISKAHDIYNKQAPKIQEQLNSTGELLESVNNPKNVMSLGQARTLMLRAMGMNRYNQQEANAVVPQTLQGDIEKLFTMGGSDDVPLPPNIQRSLNTFALSHLGNLQKTHNNLTQNALGSYQTNPYYDQNRGTQLESQLGKPINTQITEYQNKYKNLPTTAQAPGEKPANPGLWGYLTGKVTGSNQGASNKIKMIAPDGRVGEASPENVDNLIKKGYKQVK